MKAVHVGVVVESRLVEMDVGVGEAGAVVECHASDAKFLERVGEDLKACPLEGKIGLSTCGQQSVMVTCVRDGEWEGSFPTVTDMKPILDAVRNCVVFCDDIWLGFWDS